MEHFPLSPFWNWNILDFIRDFVKEKLDSKRKYLFQRRHITRYYDRVDLELHCKMRGSGVEITSIGKFFILMVIKDSKRFRLNPPHSSSYGCPLACSGYMPIINGKCPLAFTTPADQTGGPRGGSRCVGPSWSTVVCGPRSAG